MLEKNRKITKTHIACEPNISLRSPPAILVVDRAILFSSRLPKICSHNGRAHHRDCGADHRRRAEGASGKVPGKGAGEQCAGKFGECAPRDQPPLSPETFS